MLAERLQSSRFGAARRCATDHRSPEAPQDPSPARQVIRLRHPSSEARAGRRGASGSITWEYRWFSFASRLRRALLCDYEPFPVVDPKDADGNVRPVTALAVNPDRAGGAPVALGRSELTLDGREAVALGPVDRCKENPGGVVGKRAPDPRSLSERRAVLTHVRLGGRHLGGRRHAAEDTPLRLRKRAFATKPLSTFASPIRQRG